MNAREILSGVAGFLFVLGYIPYIRAILRGETKPAKASWIIWGSLDTITLAGMIAKDAVNGQMIGAVIGVWIVIVLNMKYGVPGWTTLDKFCLAGAVLGIVLWQIFSDPVLGIVTSQIVVFIGSVPTFVSAWYDPGRENRTAWTLFWFSCVCAVIAIPALTWADATQPITFFAVESIMMYILYVRVRTVRKQLEAARQAGIECGARLDKIFEEYKKENPQL